MPAKSRLQGEPVGYEVPGGFFDDLKIKPYDTLKFLHQFPMMLGSLLS